MIKRLINYIQYRFDSKTYWKMRSYCQKHHNLIQLAYLILLRRIENKMNSSTGLGLNTNYSPMCNIDSPLKLPHRLNNIIIARNVRIGKNVTIYHNVTIAEDDINKTTFIGDNVMIGAGAVILKNCKIGNNAKIGANAVVTIDIPENGVAAGNPAKIIKS